MRIILLLLCAVVCAFAQTPDYGRDMQGPFRLYRGTTTPATCTVGDLFFDTDATAGQNLFACTSTNTWTLQSGSGTTYTNSDGFLSIAGSVINVTPGAFMEVSGTNTPNGSFDFSGVSSWYPPQGASDPATCSASPRQWFFNFTSNVLKYCSATNVWTTLSGGTSSHNIADDLVTWQPCYVTPGGTNTSVEWIYPTTNAPAVTTSQGNAEMGTKECVADFAFDAVNKISLYKTFIVPAGFTSLDLYLVVQSSSGAASGAADTVWSVGYKTFASGGNPHSDAGAWTTTNSVTVPVTNTTGIIAMGTITSAVTVAQCPVGNMCTIKLSRNANNAYNGIAYLRQVKPIFNRTKTF